jgi:putative membrane protein
MKYNNKNWFSFLLKGSGYHIQGMLWSMFTIGMFTTAICYMQFELQLFTIEIPLALHSLLGIVVGLLLVFRTNTAYDRWWEGRRHLGQLVNTCRFLAVKLKAYLRRGNEAKRDMSLDMLAAFCYSLKQHLRDKKCEDINKYLPEKYRKGFEDAAHKPLFVMEKLSGLVREKFSSGIISGEQLIVLENALSQLTDILGACERIKNTPIPIAYALHLKRILLLYSVTLPFGLIHELQWWSIPAVMLVFYTMIGIEIIGEEIEEPFGTDRNDLPVDQITTNILLNLEQVRLSETPEDTP